jgi:hypothetical protein
MRGEVGGAWQWGLRHAAAIDFVRRPFEPPDQCATEHHANHTIPEPVQNEAREECVEELPRVCSAYERHAAVSLPKTPCTNLFRVGHRGDFRYDRQP